MYCAARQAGADVAPERNQYRRVARHETTLRIVPDLDLPRCQDVGRLPHRFEEQLRVDSGRLVRILVVIGKRLVLGSLCDHPRVLLKLNPTHLGSPHVLDCN